jgi:hypothetical protein
MSVALVGEFRSNLVVVQFFVPASEERHSHCHSEEQRDEESLVSACVEERFFASAARRLRMTLP